jgi:hypothetical protein
MDISHTLAPTSDQLDAVDLLGGPRVFTIERVSEGSSEQPVQVHLAEFPRPWRPGKSMRRVLAAAWGTNTKTWIGKRVTLYCDPDVKFGGEAVGGTRISHMSDLPGGKALRVPLLAGRGKSQVWTVQPLADAPAPRQGRQHPAAPDVDAIDDVETLRAMWQSADAATRKRIEARVAALQQQPAEPAFDDTEWLGGEPA